MPVYNPTSIVSVTYADADGNHQPIDPAEYTLNLHLVRPALMYSGAQESEEFIVTYKAGYPTNAEVPEDLVLAVVAACDHAWNQRDGDDLGPIYRALKNRKYASYL